jgi:polyisoprenoid-binding protein YceI
MKKLLLATVFTLALPLAAFAQTAPAGTYKLDKTHASLIWKVNHMGLSNYAARFTDLDATIQYNPADLSKSRVVATIDPASVETDYPGEKDFDEQLSTGDDWFNSKKFPEIKFESTSITKLNDTKGTMTGNVTFMGVTKPVTLDVTFNAALAEHPMNKQPAIGFSASGKLKRSDFGMTKYIPMVGDEVEVQLELEFHKAN